MAGHSKWANIKHRKAAQDSKRGKLFTRLIREITVAARFGALADNPRLRTAVDKALAANMPKDTIERAIKRGSGEDSGQQFDEVTYEGYGVGGVAILVQTMTDNKNRTVAEVRHAFSKGGGNLGTEGSVSYLFKQQGEIRYPLSAYNEDKLLEVALEAGAEDMSIEDDWITVVTTAAELHHIKHALTAAGFDTDQVDLAMVPQSLIPVAGETGLKVLKLLDRLEDLDDVQQVYTNADFADDVIAQYK